MQPGRYPQKAPVPIAPYTAPPMHLYGQPMMAWPSYMMQYAPPMPVMMQQPSVHVAEPHQAEDEDDEDDDDYEEEIAEYGADLQRAVASEGYSTPTPIQEQAIPHLLKGRDILGCAQTGTGKTAAFSLPMLQYLTTHPAPVKPRYPRALILAPTRELAAQIGDSITAYGRFLHVSHTVIFGGVGQEPQTQAVLRGVAILVATPGRLLDLMQQGYIHLNNIEIFVLDEADRMLDMGFLPDVKRIISALPDKRQSLFFSATLEPPVVALANTLVRNPVHITVTPEQPTVERISQRVLFVDKENKAPLLVHLLRSQPAMTKVIVFTQMKHQANKVVQHLAKSGIAAVAIHGNKSQTARLQALAGFKANTVRVLAATDIAARGLDIDGVSHVVNFDLPNVPETYVHRIGRTGRAGAGGDSLSFCAAEERDFLRDIEHFIRRPVSVDASHPFHSDAARDATGAAARPSPKQPRGSRGGQERRGGTASSGGGGNRGKHARGGSHQHQANGHMAQPQLQLHAHSGSNNHRQHHESHVPSPAVQVLQHVQMPVQQAPVAAAKMQQRGGGAAGALPGAPRHHSGAPRGATSGGHGGHRGAGGRGRGGRGGRGRGGSGQAASNNSNTQA